MAVLVDANVLIDVATEDAAWFGWSAQAIDRAGREGSLVINLDRLRPHRDPGRGAPRSGVPPRGDPWAAAFLAGKAFARYRGRGAVRRSPLPDFFIGAHAAVRGYRLLTRDRARYASYFPTVPLLAPTSG